MSEKNNHFLKNSFLKHIIVTMMSLAVSLSMFAGVNITAAAGNTAETVNVTKAAGNTAETVNVTKAAGYTDTVTDKDIVILYTNDVHCGVDDNIGYGGLALYKKQMEAQTSYVTLVDAGDAIQGAPIGTLSKGSYLIDIMNEVGYDIAVPGNHEFDYGMKRFMELAGKLKCGYISCNFTDLKTGNTVFSPYMMKDYGSTKVAFVGVSTPESFTKSTPKYFQDKDGNFIYGFCEDGTGASLYAKVQANVNEARNAGADYVILVGHLGEKGVTDIWSSDQVVAHTTGIDAVIDGHSHETVQGNKVKNLDGKEVTITQTGTKLKNIGRMVIHADGELSTELVPLVSGDADSYTYTTIKGDSLRSIAKDQLGSSDRWKEIYNLNSGLIRNPKIIYSNMRLIIPMSISTTNKGKAVDTATQTFIQNIEGRYETEIKKVVGSSEEDLTTLDTATGRRAIRNSETNLGDFCADAFREETGADIGFMNGGGIRADIKKGDIAYEDVLSVFPYGNMTCVIEATGQQVLDALEMASRNFPEECGGFLQVSGITYTIDTSVPSSVVTDVKGSFVKVSGKYRVCDVMVGGIPLDLTKTYTVASHNYMLRNSGDGMSMFEGCPVVKDDIEVDVDTLMNYISGLGGNIGADYSDPKGQGRINTK